MNAFVQLVSVSVQLCATYRLRCAAELYSPPSTRLQYRKRKKCGRVAGKKNMRFSNSCQSVRSLVQTIIFPVLREDKNARVEDWESGRVEECKSGRVEEWRSGGVEELREVDKLREIERD